MLSSLATVAPGSVPVMVCSTSEPTRTFGPSTGFWVSVSSDETPPDVANSWAGSGALYVFGSAWVNPEGNGSFTKSCLLIATTSTLASNPLIRAFRVPLNAGAWVPVPSAPMAPLTVAGTPLEVRVRCTDDAASKLALAAASCSDGVPDALPGPPQAASAATVTRTSPSQTIAMVRLAEPVPRVRARWAGLAAVRVRDALMGCNLPGRGCPLSAAPGCRCPCPGR